MNRKISVTFAVFLLMVLAPCPALPWTWTPVQMSVWKPVQLFPENFDVYGIRTNLVYGHNRNLSGLDIGAINWIDGTQCGVQAGLFNYSKVAWGLNMGLMSYTDNLHGFQAGLFNTTQVASNGIQAAAFINLSKYVRGGQVHFGILGNGAVDVDGAQMALLTGYNLTDDINGLQLAVLGFNLANESVDGVQAALFYNYAKNLRGLQLGLVNACENLYGVQIGLLNIIWKEKIPYMPLINFRF